MNRIRREASANTWSDDVVRRCSDDPLNFTLFQEYVILEIYGRDKSTSIPFIHRVWYVLAIFVYLVGKWLISLIRSPPELSGNVFCCHSMAPYKYESFQTLSRYFGERGLDTCILTVTGCRRQFLESTHFNSSDVVTFSEIFVAASPTRLLIELPRLWRLNRQMADLLEVDSVRHRIIAFNFLVTEAIKYQSLSRSLSDVESFHTFAPMPYQLKSIDNDILYAYQHGIEAGEGNRSFSIPKFTPLTFFVWGDIWTNEFTKRAHPESRILPVGSPRYDQMLERRDEREKIFDVLFISGTHTLDEPDLDTNAYDTLVDTVVQLCRKNDWKLGVKLHPSESPGYYRRRGYGEYLVSEEDISRLLLNSELAVTDISSALTESVVLGTPMVVAQQSTTKYRLDSFGKCEGLAFPNDIEEVEREITRLKGSTVPVDEVVNSGLMNLCGSQSRILHIVRDGDNAR